MMRLINSFGVDYISSKCLQESGLFIILAKNEITIRKNSSKILLQNWSFSTKLTFFATKELSLKCHQKPSLAAIKSSSKNHLHTKIHRPNISLKRSWHIETLYPQQYHLISNLLCLYYVGASHPQGWARRNCAPFLLKNGIYLNCCCNHVMYMVYGLIPSVYYNNNVISERYIKQYPIIIIFHACAYC